MYNIPGSTKILEIGVVGNQQHNGEYNEDGAVVTMIFNVVAYLEGNRVLSHQYFSGRESNVNRLAAKIAANCSVVKDLDKSCWVESTHLYTYSEKSDQYNRSLENNNEY